MLERCSTRTQVSVSVASTKESTRPKSGKISKKRIFRAALCRIVYLFCTRAVQPART